jgi:hypothetical protein
MVQNESIISPEEQLQLVKDKLIDISRTPVYHSSENSLPPTPENEYNDNNELTTSYNSLELPQFPVS